MPEDKLIQDKGRHHWVCSSWKRQTETDREWETGEREEGKRDGVERQEAVFHEVLTARRCICMKRWHLGLSQFYICSTVRDNRVFTSFLSVCAKSRLCKASVLKFITGTERFWALLVFWKTTCRYVLITALLLWRDIMTKATLVEKAFNWRLAYSFRGLVH